jgi:predicted ATPase/class 3 adenylate cyclase
MGALPAGTVTFLFTDIEGSTALLAELGAEEYRFQLDRHRDALREAFERHGGAVVDTQGDAFFVAFPTATGACRAALDGQGALAGGLVRVRMGIDTGEPLATGDNYIGLNVHRAARVAAAAHGGQVILSEATRVLVEDAFELRDLGLHRLKDLAAPQRLFQLGGGEFPPPESLDRTNLPVPTTPFIGRLREVAALVALLEREDVRLVTLVGAGGAGKTRLALQAAADAADAFPDGVTWVALSAVTDPALVLPAVAAAHGISPRENVTLQEALVAAYSHRTALLLLDNLEQVIDAAAQVAVLVERCPRLTVLVTSREPLRVQAEHVVPVETLERHDAVALFAARAKAASEAFEATGPLDELCTRLDDLPLALELAAARVRTMSVEVLLERLGGALDLLRGGRDADARQRTLRATIEWSHALLDEEEQRAFRRLAVFVDSCTLRQAEEIAEADLDVIASLVEKSLLKRRPDDGEDRYWMLDTIHAFAAERLSESGEEARLRDLHAAWFARRTIEIGRPMTEHLGRGVHELSRDFNEIRLAIERLDGTGRDDLVAEVVHYASFYWFFVAGPLEGLPWVRRALERRPPEPLRTRLENSLAMMLLFDDRVESRRVARSILARDVDPVDATWAWVTIGNAHLSDGDAAAADAAYAQALAVADQHGLVYWADLVAANLSSSALALGELERAEELARRAALSADGGQVAQARVTLAAIALRRGDLQRARADVLDAIGPAETEAPLFLLWIVRFLARIDATEGRLERAALLAGWVEAESRRLAVAPDVSDEEDETAIREFLAAGLDATTTAAVRARGAALTRDEVIVLARSS